MGLKRPQTRVERGDSDKMKNSVIKWLKKELRIVEEHKKEIEQVIKERKDYIAALEKAKKPKRQQSAKS